MGDGGRRYQCPTEKLNSPLLTEFFRHSGLNFLKTGVGTFRERITTGNYSNETETLRFIHALKQTLWEMDTQYPNASK